MSTLKELFLNELADMYDAEDRITKALPKVIRAATCEELQNALQHHLDETEAQVLKLNRVFAAFNEKPKAKKCPAIVGILAESEEIISENKNTPSINAAIISAAQKIEHFEIASYGCLHAWAQELDNSEGADILEEILNEEKRADKTLTELSIAKNEEALEGVNVGPGSNN